MLINESSKGSFVGISMVMLRNKMFVYFFTIYHVITSIKNSKLLGECYRFIVSKMNTHNKVPNIYFTFSTLV